MQYESKRWVVTEAHLAYLGVSEPGAAPLKAVKGCNDSCHDTFLSILKLTCVAIFENTLEK